MKAIEINRLTKIYKSSLFSKNSSVVAIRTLSLTVEMGTIYTLLGPNGAGKTTLIKILSGLTPPTEGEATVAGISVRDQGALAKKIGLFITGGAGYLGSMSGLENFKFFAALQNMAPALTRCRIAELASRLGLEPYLGKKVRTYSDGIRQRFLLARALLHDPEILLLDEPISHLDPLAARQFHLLLRDCVVKDFEKTILLTTHQLEEAEEISDTIAFLFQGDLLWEKPAEFFKSGRTNLIDEYLETMDQRSR